MTTTTIKTACQHCGQHVEFDSNLIGQTAPCPACGLTVALAVPGYVPPAAIVPPALPPIMRQGRPVPSRQTSAAGVIVQIIGILFCLSIIGAIIGIPLWIAGYNMDCCHKCSECGSRVEKYAKLCPACQCHFH